MNFAEVQAHLWDLYERFTEPTADRDGQPHAGPVFAYDPQYAPALAQQVTDHWPNMTPIPQTDTRMVPAAENLHEAIVSGRLARDGDLTLARHVVAAMARGAMQGRDWRLTKPKGSSS